MSCLRHARRARSVWEVVVDYERVGEAVTGAVLTAWLSQKGSESTRDTATRAVDGVRFAFYGRVSTVRFQDRNSSRAWQREMADDLVVGHGEIVTEFFDVGCSRRVPWRQRPAARALLAAVAAPDRVFDAVVVGEYERAFFGDQLTALLPVLRGSGVGLWLPELDGPVDVDDPAHQAVLTVLGAQSRREVVRARCRVLAAMQAQVREEGRYLGGRPPYGYRLADVGRHPNGEHARWGRRLRRLVPDPQTAPHVRCGCSRSG
jgi:site-specific DNA recombinase